MSQNPYLDAQQLLKEMTSRYEEMFAQFSAMRKVFAEEASKELPLVARYGEVLSSQRNKIHDDFSPLRAEIEQLSEKTLVHTLISKIPRVPIEK
jgi:hypothetical protein